MQMMVQQGGESIPLVGYVAKSLKVALPLLQLHRAFFIVIDDAVFTLRTPESKQFLE